MKARLFALILLAVLLTSCVSTTSSTQKESNTVETQDNIYLRNQPIPIYDYSPERDIFIQLYNFRMDNVQTWTVICSNMGNCIDSCASLGYPIPADVQLTNPIKAQSLYTASESVYTVEQREPNGLFSSKNTAGTWVMCVYKDGVVEPVYTELNATAYAHPVKIVDGVIVHDMGAESSVKIDTSNLDSNKGKPPKYQEEPTSTPEVPAP